MQATYINSGSMTLELKFAEEHIGDGQHGNVLLCLPNGRSEELNLALKLIKSSRSPVGKAEENIFRKRISKKVN